jgi:hypothetical protein
LLERNLNSSEYKEFEGSGPGPRALASFSLKIQGTFHSPLAFSRLNEKKHVTGQALFPHAADRELKQLLGPRYAEGEGFQP